jgi:hypothetical protein
MGTYLLYCQCQGARCEHTCNNSNIREPDGSILDMMTISGSQMETYLLLCQCQGARQEHTCCDDNVREPDGNIFVVMPMSGSQTGTYLLWWTYVLVVVTMSGSQLGTYLLWWQCQGARWEHTCYNDNVGELVGKCCIVVRTGSQLIIYLLIQVLSGC